MKQRAASNHLETVLQATVFILVAGLVFPEFASVLGTVYTIARHFYVVGYLKDIESRRPPIYLCLTVMLTLAAMAAYSAVKLAGYV